MSKVSFTRADGTTRLTIDVADFVEAKPTSIVSGSGTVPGTIVVHGHGDERHGVAVLEQPKDVDAIVARARANSATAKKSAAKKSTAKKSAAKKSTGQKTAAKKTTRKRSTDPRYYPD